MSMNFERCTLDEVAAALSFVSSDDRETWVRMGMAVKSEFGEDGFDAWDNWSQMYDRYDPKSVRASWRSFKLGGGITIATLFKEAQQLGWEPVQQELTEARKAELDRERRERRAKREQEQAKEAELQRQWHGVILEAATEIWEQLAPGGKSPYLGKKKILPFGARFVSRGLIVAFGPEDQPGYQLVAGREKINAFFNERDPERSFRYLKPGCLVVPLYSGNEIHNLQIIYSSGKKAFLKHGRKSGLSYLIGTISPGSPIVFVEGFATGASVHMATDYPVVVCLDAGNLPVVVTQFCEHYSRMEHSFIIAGDNDMNTPGNPGLAKALEAANECGGVAVVPQFEEVANG